MRTITATRYVTPLREGGSLPAIVEGDDDGLYVLKFRGAGQGPKALIAELVAGELARIAGLPVPEIVFAQLDVELARTEPDPEIQELIRASGGLNLALDYLPGSVTFDPLAERPDAMLASSVVWFDAFVTNLDRTPRNANLLLWHRQLWLIDHGAALYFHHQWDGFLERAASPFTLVKDHVLLPCASALAEADARMAECITPQRIAEVVALIPDEWLNDEPLFADAAAQRQAYIDYFARRLQAPRAFASEAARAHAAHL
ncbi:HipA family kinase [Aquabacterium sp.]|uniref:HipA family kinase n=1 Tax=Aquabacterium sp. TaxID=1872578 RepID=UPI002C18A7B6|nr:HipA family kinase [Aquabacterium sp.]HSW04271.1 HipA family kinase [Aquabacterium sp.]